MNSPYVSSDDTAVERTPPKGAACLQLGQKADFSVSTRLFTINADLLEPNRSPTLRLIKKPLCK
jgi:hypothetical protein